MGLKSATDRCDGTESVGYQRIKEETAMKCVQQSFWLVAPAFIGFAFVVAGCADDHSREKAEAQIQRLADDLDSKTTETGVYIRVKDGEIKETDPWGTPVKVSYSQGGVAEMIEVRSAGPDREFHTSDDLAAQRMAANLKGIGEGIKNNAEATAAGAAKGLVKGAVEGVKESIKDSLPRKKKEMQPREGAESGKTPPAKE
jgi:hypothetical protein